jgi:poly(3-hydroxybutyrate) depolymerase
MYGMDFGPGGTALRQTAALYDSFGHAATIHARPPFGITSLRIGNTEQEVVEEIAARTKFANLLHFRKPEAPKQPRVLVVAPLSGHFSTLLRGTVRVLLADHDVYITDWLNARDVPLAAGSFDLDAFTSHVIDFLAIVGPGAHVLAVCQPAAAVLAATAVMSEDDHPALPRSITLMAGPIDTRLNPTRVNQLAKTRGIGWFEKKLISTVPWPLPGTGRRVYPGFVQLSAFMSMNLDRHIGAHMAQFRSLVRGDQETAAAHRRFYDEYLAVMDLHAEFFLQTIRTVFQEHALPKGELTFRGRRVDPAAIRRTFAFTVEGELDDICAIGQTMAALDLCTNLRPGMKRHHLQTGVGHYGVFNGRRWSQEIYPLVREVIEVASCSDSSQ